MSGTDPRTSRKESRNGRDLSKGYVPVSAVLSACALLVLVVLWLANVHFTAAANNERSRANEIAIDPMRTEQALLKQQLDSMQKTLDRIEQKLIP